MDGLFLAERTEVGRPIRQHGVRDRLPATVAGLAGAAAALRRRLVRDPVVVGAAVWFALGAAAYSITAGIVHPYYTASLAPPLALLIGVGAGVLQAHRHGRVAFPLAGVAVAASGAVSWVIARRVGWAPATTLAIVTIVAGVVLGAVGLTRLRTTRIAAAAVAAVLVVPLVWSAGSLKAGLSANLPYAMPTQQSGFGRPGGPGGMGGSGGPNGSLDANLIVFLEANRGSAKWLVDRKSTRLNSSHIPLSRMPSSA